MLSTFVDDQDTIFDLLLAAGVPQVFEASLPAGTKHLEENTSIEPYALVSFGGRAPVSNADMGITSSADDLKWTTIAVEVWGESPRTVRRLAAIVRSVLEGYVISPDWGQLQEVLSGDYTVKKPDYDLSPIRFSTGIIFNTMTNASY
jgi:hypothetical protein